MSAMHTARTIAMVAYRIVVAIAALCVIALTAEAFYLQAKIGQAVSQIEDQFNPAPAATGCPFGPNDCGG